MWLEMSFCYNIFILVFSSAFREGVRDELYLYTQVSEMDCGFV